MSKLCIRAVPEDGFWRCGRFWPHAGQNVDASEFTEAEMGRLKAEKLLVVEHAATTDSDAVQEILSVLPKLSPEDMTSAGLPKVDSVTALVGRRVTGQNVKDAWDAYTSAKEDAE